MSEGREDGGISTVIVEDVHADGPADYEKAISITGYGTFNVLVLLATLPIAWTIAFDTTTSAFILATAECDFQLTFFRQGVLVAIPYIAMIFTGYLWEHIAVYTGKKNLFIFGLLIDSFLNIISTGVTSYYVYLLLKFVSGILAGGPFAMAMSYLTEFHSPKYKQPFSTWAGFSFAVPYIVPAALAMVILPLDWHIEVFDRDYNTWRIYLLICSIPSVVGLVTSTLLPESPKHLIEIGRTEEALKLFRRMYAMNSRKSADSFPIKALLAPRRSSFSRPFLRATLEKVRQTVYNTKLLFSSPYVSKFFLLAFLQFATMLGFHTMRLWVPHLFTILNNFDYDHWKPPNRSATICEMLDRRAAIPARQYVNCSHPENACYDWYIDGAVFRNSTIIASSAVLFSFLTIFISTNKPRKQIILLAAFLISLASSFGINWAQAPPYMLTLAAAVIVTMRIGGNIVTSVNVDVIPLPLRPTSVSILVAIGNLGAIVGNFIFSALLGIECIAAYAGMGCFFTVCFCLSFFLPDPVKTSPKMPV